MSFINSLPEKLPATASRRRSPRSPAERVLSIRIDPDIHAIVLNASEDGLGFRALSPVTQTGAIRFWFTDDGQRIEITGELIWTDPSRKTGGLRFVSLPAEARQWLVNWTTRPPIPPVISRAADSGVTSASESTPTLPPPFTHFPPKEVAPPASLPGSTFLPGAASLPPTPHVLPPGLPTLSRPLGSGYLMAEDDSEFAEPSRSRFLPGIVVGIILSALFVAIFLYISYGNPTGALLARWQNLIGSAPSQQSQTQPSAPLTPAASPSTGSSEVVPTTPLTSQESAAANRTQQSDQSATSAPLDSAADPKTNSTPVLPPVSAPSDSAAALNMNSTQTPSSVTEPAAKAARAKPSGATPPVKLPTPKLADVGDDDLAQAQRYLNGKSGPGGHATAVRFLWAAVEKGNATAEITLADLYARGDGVTKSCDQARVLLGAAAGKETSDASRDWAQAIRRDCR